METRRRFGVLSVALCWLGTAFTGGWHSPTRELVRRKAEKVAFGVNRNQYYLADGDDIRNEFLSTSGIQLKDCSEDSSEILEKVSLGDLGQFFCKSRDHVFWNIIDPDLNRLCREENVKFVSFGSGETAILATKGEQYYFHNISKQLQEIITGSTRSPDLTPPPIKNIVLGKDEAYFILFEDGGWTYHGIPGGLARKIRDDIKTNWPEAKITDVAFSIDLDAWYLQTKKGSKICEYCDDRSGGRFPDAEECQDYKYLYR